MIVSGYGCPPRSGLLTAVQQILRVREDGLIHGGPPCSSFTWLNRGTSKRCTEQPSGDVSQPSVRQANMTPGTQ